ncbi:hypothetical protein KLP28_08630 [Nocardioidaceae bacterium]|nr:hypothetical protein KLP28_08630 [Nocardioidaceae bacterium]
MGSVPVPGDWFDQFPAGQFDDDDLTGREHLYDLEDGYEEALDRHFGELERPEPARPDEVTRIIHELRAFSRRLAAERHPQAHVPNLLANRLNDARVPAPAPPRGKVSSPTGNCRICGNALPLPSTGRGRPRTLCLTCSPPKTQGRRSANSPGKSNR